MKLKSILSVGFFAAIASLSMGTQAASDKEPATEAMPAANMKADTNAKAKVKPHSHVEEKTGVPQSEPKAKSDKPSPAKKDMTKHSHPRDAK